MSRMHAIAGKNPHDIYRLGQQYFAVIRIPRKTEPGRIGLDTLRHAIAYHD